MLDFSMLNPATASAAFYGVTVPLGSFLFQAGVYASSSPSGWSSRSLSDKYGLPVAGLVGGAASGAYVALYRSFSSNDLISPLVSVTDFFVGAYLVYSIFAGCAGLFLMYSRLIGRRQAEGE